MASSPSGPAALEAPERDPAEVRDLIEGILARPEFRDDRPLLERVVDWVFERIGDFLGSLAGTGTGVVVAWVVVALLAAVAVALAVRIASGMRRDPAGPPLGDDVGRAPVDWARDAGAHEEAGRWREALRCRYRAVIAELAARGLVDEVPGRTAGAYRRLVAEALPDRSDAFGEATDLFEAVWYGGRPVGQDEVHRLRQRGEAVTGRREPAGVR